MSGSDGTGLAAPEAALIGQAPPLATPADVARIVADIYGLACDVRPLPAERDLNARLAFRDGREGVLRIANAGEAPDQTDVQTRALIHVAQADPTLPVPRVIPTRDGAAWTMLDLASGRHAARIVTWMTGTPLVEMAPTLGERRRLGAWLARLGRTLAEFRHEAADRILYWDLMQAGRSRGLIEVLPEPDLRDRGLALLDRHGAVLMPRLRAMRAQVVHNDFNPHNVLVAPDDPGRLTGLIDFNDLTRTALVCDLAIAASFQAVATPLEGELAFVEGYVEVTPLHAEEAAALFDLICLRNLMTAAVTAWRARRWPENARYILRNRGRAVAALRALWSLPDGEGPERLATAARGGEA